MSTQGGFSVRRSPLAALSLEARADVLALILSGDAAAALAELTPEDAASTLEVMSPENAAELLEAFVEKGPIGSRYHTEVLRVMPPEGRGRILAQMLSGDAAAALTQMSLDDAAATLESMSSDDARCILISKRFGERLPQTERISYQAAVMGAMSTKARAGMLKVLAWDDILPHLLVEMSPADAAATIEAVPPRTAGSILGNLYEKPPASTQHRAALLAALSLEARADIFGEAVYSDFTSTALAEMSLEDAAATVEAMSSLTGAAHLLEGLEGQRARVLGAMSSEGSADILASMFCDDAAVALVEMSLEDAAAALKAMPPDDKADVEDSLADIADIVGSSDHLAITHNHMIKAVQLLSIVDRTDMDCANTDGKATPSKDDDKASEQLDWLEQLKKWAK